MAQIPSESHFFLLFFFQVLCLYATLWVRTDRNSLISTLSSLLLSVIDLFDVRKELFS